MVGRPRDRITVKKLNPDATKDPNGVIDRTDPANWIEHCVRFPLNIATRGGREYWRAQQVQAETTHLITLRRDSETEAITSAMQVELDGRTLEIVASYQGDQQRREWALECKG